MPLFGRPAPTSVLQDLEREQATLSQQLRNIRQPIMDAEVRVIRGENALRDATQELRVLQERRARGVARWKELLQLVIAEKSRLEEERRRRIQGRP